MPALSHSPCRPVPAFALAAFVAAFIAGAPVRAQAPLLYEFASPDQEEDGQFGSSVSAVPDVDGDGHSDLLVGAFGADPGTSPEKAGRAYVFSGATGVLLREFASPNEEVFGFFGWSVSGVEDVDGDGWGDVLVGAPDEDSSTVLSNGGRAYVFSGSSGALLHALVSPYEESLGEFGGSVSGVGDVDGDGRGDLLIGADEEDPNGRANAGRAYAFSGASGVLLFELVSPHVGTAGAFGNSVSGVPDVDGDGRGDLLIGAIGESPGTSPTNAGRAYVFSGATGALLFELTSPQEEPFGYFGDAVSGVDDVDGDDRGDLLVGASYADPSQAPLDAGRVYVFSGATGAPLHVLASPHEESGAYFGDVVSGVPDVDGDGRCDLLIGAYSEGATHGDAGRAYVFSGATGTLLHELTSPNGEDFGLFGGSVSGVPDVDGDGRGDLLVGALAEDPGTSPDNAGRAYVFAGGIGGALAVDAEPVSPPIVVPATGGSYAFTVTITNGTAGTETFELWTRVTRPNGQQTGALRGPITRTLAPGASVTDELMQAVPGRIAAGVYTYTAYIGTFPNDVVASEGFTFTKQGTALAGREEADDAALWQEVADSPAQASASGDVPESFTLEAARPNPFSSRTVLAFTLPASAAVRLALYDVLGREVALLTDGVREAGRHEVAFDASSLPAGVYVVRLAAEGVVQTRRLTLAR